MRAAASSRTPLAPPYSRIAGQRSAAEAHGTGCSLRLSGSARMRCTRLTAQAAGIHSQRIVIGRISSNARCAPGRGSRHRHRHGLQVRPSRRLPPGNHGDHRRLGRVHVPDRRSRGRVPLHRDRQRIRPHRNAHVGAGDTYAADGTLLSRGHVPRRRAHDGHERQGRSSSREATSTSSAAPLHLPVGAWLGSPRGHSSR